MSGIANKILLVGDKFMPEMHLKQSGFTYSAWDPFTKNKERIEKSMATDNSYFIYKNELVKARFQHDMAYGKTKDLAKRTQSDKVLRDKAFKVASNPKYDGHQGGLAFMVCKFVSKKSSGNGIGNKLIINWLKNYTTQLFENSRKKKFIHHLETIFGWLI